LQFCSAENFSNQHYTKSGFFRKLSLHTTALNMINMCYVFYTKTEQSLSAMTTRVRKLHTSNNQMWQNWQQHFPCSKYRTITASMSPNWL